MLIKDKGKLTIISVSSVLQITVKHEIKLTRVVDGRQAYKVRNRGKEYFLDITPDVLVFDGWSIPFSICGDVANGKLNFTTDKPGDLRQFIDKKNLNANFCWFENVLYREPGSKIDNKLY